MLGLLKTDLETVGLVEIFQRSEAGPSTQKGYLRFLMQMCELAGDFLKSHQLRHFSHRQTLWTQLEDFTRAVHASLDPRETAYTIANEGRRLIECDRVSVAIRKGKKCKIEAISGQDLFDKRSNTVRLLGKLATAVVASGDAVWYTGDTRDLPPQVEDAVQEYVDEAHSKTVAVLPLGRPAPAEEDDPKKRVEPEAPIGALIVEQIEDSRVAGSLVQRADVVCRHSSTALANALEHQNLFLMPVWRALGKTRWVLQARTLPKTLSIAGGVLLVLLVLGFGRPGSRWSRKARSNRWCGRTFSPASTAWCKNCIVPTATRSRRTTLVQLRNTDLEVAIATCKASDWRPTRQLFAVQRSLVRREEAEHRGANRLEANRPSCSEKQQTLDAQWGAVQGQAAGVGSQEPDRRAGGHVGPAEPADRSPGAARPGAARVADRGAGRGREAEHRGAQSAGRRTGGGEAEAADARRPMGLYKAKQRELDVKSPISGVVVTWDLRNRADPAAGAARPGVVARGRSRRAVAIGTAHAREPHGPHRRAAAGTVRYSRGQKLRELLARRDIRGQVGRGGDGGRRRKGRRRGAGRGAGRETARPHPGGVAAAVRQPAASDPQGRDRRGDPRQAGRSAARGVVRRGPRKLQAILPEVRPDGDLCGQAERAARPRRSPDDRLEVSYILATEPGTTHYGTVKEIHRSAEVRGDEGNTVLIKVAIDKADLPDLRPGATVTAQVYCGHRSLGYVLLHDVIAFIQSRILFRYF